MQVEFKQHEGELDPVVGLFIMEITDCLTYLESHFTAHSIPADHELHKWLTHRSQDCPSMPVRIPERFEDRAGYMLTTLLEHDRPVEIICGNCTIAIPREHVQRECWDLTSETEGMKMGFDGFHLVCPAGHKLVSIITKIY